MNDLIKLETERLYINQILDADPKEFLELYNSVPDFIEASWQYTGRREYKLDEVSLDLWQEINRENSYFFEIRLKENSKLIGILACLIPSPEISQPWIGLFIIHGEYHKKGLGKEVIEEFLKYLKEQDWGKVRVNVMKDYGSVLDFWKKLGFEVTEETLDDDKRTVYALIKRL